MDEKVNDAVIRLLQDVIRYARAEGFYEAFLQHSQMDMAQVAEYTEAREKATKNKQDAAQSIVTLLSR